MKKIAKIVLATMLLGAVGLNLAIDANGRINLGMAKVGARSTTQEEVKWERIQVDCLDDDDEVYDSIYGCFLGNEDGCLPESCPPQPTKTKSEEEK